MKRSLVLLALVGILTLTSHASAAVLFELGSEWNWLHPQGGAAADPAIADPDFNDPTGGWFANASDFAANYNGPAFATGNGLFGYGSINLPTTPIVTDIVDPGTNNRFTAYFRREFTAIAGFQTYSVDILADDGAIIYIDGIERGRINMNGQTEGFQTFTPGNANGNEDALVNVSLNGGLPLDLGAGPHTIAVSMHNSSATSTDLGFDLRLNNLLTNFGQLAPKGSGFSQAALNAVSHVGGPNPGDDLGFSSSGGGAESGVKDSTSGTPGLTIPGNAQFLSRTTPNLNFVTEPVDVRGLQNILASVDVRAFLASGTFEADDILTISLEGSVNGLTFDQVGLPSNIVIQGTAPLGALVLPNEAFTNQAFPAIATYDGALRMRIARTGSGSVNELIYWDNIVIDDAPIGGETDPINAIFNPVSGSNRTPGQTIAVSNPSTSANAQDAATLANLAITQGLNGTFSQSGLANGQIAEDGSQTGTIAFDKTGLLNGVQATATISFDIQSGPNGPGTGAGAKTYTLTATVTGNSGTQTAVVPTGGSYGGLSGTSDKQVGSVADLLAGTNVGDQTTAQMTWRNRNPNETAPTGTTPPLPFFASNLISDVVTLTGTEGDVVVLQIHYDENLLQDTEEALTPLGYIQLVTFDASRNLWVNAIDLNAGANVGAANVQGAWSGQLALGTWGVDVAANTVWAVIDHGGQFAAVPEPSTLLLMGAGLVGLAIFRRRRRG